MALAEQIVTKTLYYKKTCTKKCNKEVQKGQDARSFQCHYALQLLNVTRLVYLHDPESYVGFNKSYRQGVHSPNQTSQTVRDYIKTE